MEIPKDAHIQNILSFTAESCAQASNHGRKKNTAGAKIPESGTATVYEKHPICGSSQPCTELIKTQPFKNPNNPPITLRMLQIISKNFDMLVIYRY